MHSATRAPEIDYARFKPPTAFPQRSTALIEASKSYTKGEREKATTMSDGSFPIDNVGDLKRAIKAVGRAKDVAKAKAWVRKRAKALNAEGLIPDGW